MLTAVHDLSPWLETSEPQPVDDPAPEPEPSPAPPPPDDGK